MNSEFKKGVTNGLIIYSIGILATAFVHLIYGWSYPHGAPPSAIPILLTLAVSAIRVVTCGISLITRKSETAKGELIVHACAALLFAVIISILRIKE